LIASGVRTNLNNHDYQINRNSQTQLAFPKSVQSLMLTADPFLTKMHGCDSSLDRQTMLNKHGIGAEQQKDSEILYRQYQCHGSGHR
jgi:hypothetical protein